MKLSFLTIFAFLAVAVSNGIAASPVPGSEQLTQESDVALGRGLRKKSDGLRKKKTDEVKHFNHVRLEEVAVRLSGPGDYSKPSEEEIRFLTDALMTSFEKTDEDFGYEAGIAIMESIQDVEGVGDGDDRKLMAFWDLEWYYQFSAHCRFCPTGWDDDDIIWLRRLDEEQRPAPQRALRQVLEDKGTKWADYFCTLLQTGPYVFFHSVVACSFTDKEKNFPASFAGVI